MGRHGADIDRCRDDSVVETGRRVAADPAFSKTHGKSVLRGGIPVGSVCMIKIVH
jgi:hypothetical protein